MGIFMLQTFGEPADFEKIVFTTEDLTTDGPEPTVILNKNYPNTNTYSNQIFSGGGGSRT